VRGEGLVVEQVVARDAAGEAVARQLDLEARGDSTEWGG